MKRFGGMAVAGVLGAITLAAGAQPALNITQHHNHLSRDGLYLEPAFTKTAVAGLKRDLSFDGRISGDVYAQPLYLEGGPGGKAMIIAVTESNNVYALDAANGSVLWRVHVGAPMPLSQMPCGNIDPLGITGTPAVDLPSRTLFFDAMTTPDGGSTKQHLIFALNVDTGTTNSGWPISVDATARFGATSFTSAPQGERGALAVVDGTLYVPYGGLYGDCGTYYGWLVGVPLNNPASVTAWATTARGGGAWGVGGVASDGTNLFIATGNTFGASTWSGGEAIIRLQPGPTLNSLAANYWAPTNWLDLDLHDTDLGGSGALLVDVPGATPSQLIVSLGKDGNAYLLNRGNLGGVSLPLASKNISGNAIIQAAACYRTTQATYVVCRTSSGLLAFRITATAPPTIATGWTVSQNGRGSPFVTSTDGTNNMIVWTVGAEGDERLHGYDGDTGAVVYSGGGANELMTGTRRFNSGIAARGRLYVANAGRVYAFALPIAPIVLTQPTLTHGVFQASFTNLAGLGFTAFGSTNAKAPLSNWSSLGLVPEATPGHFQLTDPRASNQPQRFYRIRSP